MIVVSVRRQGLFAGMQMAGAAPTAPAATTALAQEENPEVSMTRARAPSSPEDLFAGEEAALAVSELGAHALWRVWRRSVALACGHRRQHGHDERRFARRHERDQRHCQHRSCAWEVR